MFHYKGVDVYSDFEIGVPIINFIQDGIKVYATSIILPTEEGFVHVSTQVSHSPDHPHTTPIGEGCLTKLYFTTAWENDGQPQNSKWLSKPTDVVKLLEQYNEYRDNGNTIARLVISNTSGL